VINSNIQCIGKKVSKQSKEIFMKKILVLLAVLMALTFTVTADPNVDTITAASGQAYYGGSSYDLPALQAALGAYPYATTIAVSSINADGSPNMSVVIPGITDDGKYLTFGLAGNRTRENFIQREIAVVLFYEYTPTAEKAERNKGCRVVVKYVGDRKNNQLNEAAGNERPSLFMEIVEILPLG